MLSLYHRCASPLLACMAATGLHAAVITYPAPEQQTSFYAKSARYSVTADGNNVFVYDFDPGDTLAVRPNSLSPQPTVWDPGVFGYFDFSGSVTVRVTVSGSPVTSALIRPRSLGLATSISGNVITFTLTRPCNFGLEVNGASENPLFLFANPIAPVPSTTDPNVVFIGGDSIYYNYDWPAIKGKTLYIEGGAIVCCNKGITGDLSGTKILGRGIVTGKTPRSDQQVFGWANGKGLLMNGPIFFTSNNGGQWGFVPFEVDGGDFINVKVIGLYRDAFDVLSSSNVVVDSCFFWCRDDACVIKGSQWSDEPMRNITIKNSVTWNHGLMIGFETRAPSIRNITFSNNDIVRPRSNTGNPITPHAQNVLWNPVIGIVCSDQANVSNVRYDDIRIEDPWTDCIFQFMNSKNYATTNNGNSSINGVYFKNIRTINTDERLTGMYRSIVVGNGALSMVSNILFEGLTWNGTPISTAAAATITIGTYVQNVNFQALAARTTAPAAPTSLEVVAVPSARTLLTWTDNAGNEDGFIIERKMANGQFAVIDTVVANFNNYYDLDLLEVAYTYRIRSYNSAGVSAYTSEKSATVLGQTPFKGTPFSIPGVIEAEDFDIGGQSISWYDSDGGNGQGSSGGAYRKDVDVDMGTSGTMVYVGWTTDGEWMEYSITVPTAGTYAFDVMAATIATDAKFHIDIDGISKTGVVPVAQTAAWTTYGVTTTPAMDLSAGSHVLRFAIDKAPINFDNMTAKSALPTGVAIAGAAMVQARTSVLHRTYDIRGRLVFAGELDGSMKQCNRKLPAGCYFRRSQGTRLQKFAIR